MNANSPKLSNNKDLDPDLTAKELDVAARVGELDGPAFAIDFAAMAAVSNVYRVASTVRNHMEREVLAADQLSWTAFASLFVLWVWGPQELYRLADETYVTKATMSGVVNTLEGRGLVGRESSTTDRRRVVVSLTHEGLALITRLFPVFNHHESIVTKRLSATERRSLAHLLREVLRTVED
jgi:MarR family transcriptional regulator, organic hydroperoxide resistance regulator